MKVMNIKTKLVLGIGMLAGMIILLVTLSVVNLQILTATEPDSPAAMPGLERALLWISITGGICIFTGLGLLYWLPRSISKPVKELKDGILEIANHNYEKRLDMSDNEEFREVADSFNRMAERLTEYRASTLSDILSAKKFIEAIVNSIDDPIIGLNTEREILFINDEALSILNMKRENVIRKSAEELSLKNDLLRRLIRELVTPSDQKEPLKIYADNKESYFKASYILINNTDAACNAVEYLIKKGHREIGYLRGDYRIKGFQYREYGYHRALQRHGLSSPPDGIVTVGTQLESSYEGMRRYLEKNPKLPTAFFADNDVIALGVMKAMQEKGIEIPAQVSIVGFDDINFGTVSVPALTTIHVFKQEMGEVAVRRVLDHVRYSDSKIKMKIQVYTEFTERDSVRELL